MTVDRGALVTANGSYVCAEGGGGRELVANRPARGPWETFRFAWLSPGDLANRGTVALIAANGQYVCAEGGGGRELVANRGAIGPWETFRYIWWEAEDKISLQTANGSYVCAEGGGGREVVANSSRDRRVGDVLDRGRLTFSPDDANIAWDETSGAEAYPRCRL